MAAAALSNALCLTLNPMPLLATPPTVTTMGPLVAPFGTGTVMLVADHAVGAANVPLKVTVLPPRDAPKFEPAIVTGVMTEPDVGDRLVIVGADALEIVNATSLEYPLTSPAVSYA